MSSKSEKDLLLFLHPFLANRTFQMGSIFGSMSYLAITASDLSDRMLAARWKREISLEYLTEEKFVPLSTTDEYFQVPDYGETYLLSVRGQTIFLDSCSLAAALAGLPEQTQEEIFLYYFQYLTQKEIGEQSGWTRSTIGRHIQLALKRLKEEMEVLSHE